MKPFFQYKLFDLGMSSDDGNLNEIDDAKKKKIKQLGMRTINDSITDAILGACAPCFKVFKFLYTFTTALSLFFDKLSYAEIVKK